MSEALNTTNIQKLYFKDTSFASLMRRRIYNILLYASKYDAFVLEEDGRIDEMIFNEYVSLNLRYPPRFTLVSSQEEAEEQLKERKFELIISMPGGDSLNPFEWAKSVKQEYPDIPIVILTPFSRMVSQRIAHEDLSAIDYVFSWLGNSDILLAIIKLIEDRMNVEEDVDSVGVQVILYVEDSIRWYSSVVPQLYKYVLKQSRDFMTEALNAHEQMLRLRGRPKILLARSYDEGMAIYEKFKHNMLGVITDVSYPQDGVMTKMAGINLCKEIRNQDKYIPLICLSTENSNRSAASGAHAAFLDKMSKTLMLELREKIAKTFGFGDFVFINPETGMEEARIQNLKGLQDIIFKVSNESLFYHVSRNNISRWLYSRAMFPLAEFLKNISVEHLLDDDLSRVREIIFDAIVQYRRVKNKGIVAVFERERYDKYSNFARIGEGSLGGKGRGLAFIDAMIKRHESMEHFENTQILIPKTVVLCTEIFTQFMEQNKLYPLAMSDLPDEEILGHFLKARIPQSLIADLMAYLKVVSGPVAVRSSSLLEDSHYQPFAGIYTTYMVPYVAESKSHMLEMISEAIKAVYASVFYKDTKAYMTATKNVIDEEKMAIVLQETVGKSYETRFYPSFSGVARSLNYYPIGNEKSDEGIVSLAMGLGKYIMDGGQTLRFSPEYPGHVLQTSTPEMALRETQTSFYALDLEQTQFVPRVDDGFNLLQLPLTEAEKDGTLKFIASTYNFHDEVIQDGLYPGGRKLVTFANILKHNVFPLAGILKNLLHVAQKEMGRPVEIEFAVNLDYSAKKQHNFYLLQIRPIVDSKEMLNEDVGSIPDENVVIRSNSTLGHGITNDIFDLIYVRPEHFSAANSRKIMEEIEHLNAKLMNEKRYYILIGPGRWGSADPWLGIPVKWPQICNARLIVEAGLSKYRIDPSQGTHFFQNLTSFGVMYFTVNPYCGDGSYEVDYLDAMPACYESDFVRHVRTDDPFVVKVDGRKNMGVVLKG